MFKEFPSIFRFTNRQGFGERMGNCCKSDLNTANIILKNTMVYEMLNKLYID